MLEIKLLPDSEVEITGEIQADFFESKRRQAVQEISEKVSIDGFRPGKVPEDILIKKVGEQEILEKMATLALQEKYPQIIEEHKIKAIGRPAVTITKIASNNPLGFKVRTFVVPEVDLPDYKKISQEVVQDLEKDKRRFEIIDKIIGETKINVPVILVEAEKHKISEEAKNNLAYLGLKWEDYLLHLKKTEEELLKDWERESIRRIKASLILDKIAETENISVSEEELNAETEKIKEKYSGVDINRLRVYIYDVIRNEKVFNLLELC